MFAVPGDKADMQGDHQGDTEHKLRAEAQSSPFPCRRPVIGTQHSKPAGLVG
jgi:hypothetical protein